MPFSVVPLKALPNWNDAMEGDGQKNDHCQRTNFGVCIECPYPGDELVTTQPHLHQSRAQDEPRGYPNGHPKVDQVLGY